MASINRYQTINDIPASKGKSVLLKILNSPRADFSRLQKIASDYEKTALEMMKAELCKNEPFCNWRWQRLLLFRFRSWVFKFRGQFFLSKKQTLFFNFFNVIYKFFYSPNIISILFRICFYISLWNN